jgi:hypothetical protein
VLLVPSPPCGGQRREKPDEQWRRIRIAAVQRRAENALPNNRSRPEAGCHQRRRGCRVDRQRKNAAAS